MNQKWYEKNVTIILFLLFFTPIGLYLMWKYSKWDIFAQILISILIVIITVVYMGINLRETQRKANSRTSKIESLTNQMQEEINQMPENNKKATNHYAIVNIKDEQGYKHFYVAMYKVDKDSCIDIISEFKRKYTKDRLKHGFEIGFFVLKNRNDAVNQDYTTAKAMYHENYDNGESELYFRDTDEKIEIK